MFQIPSLLFKSRETEDKSVSEVPCEENLVRGCVDIHNSCPMENVATPRKYLTFLYTYISVYCQKKDGIENRRKHLQVCSYLFTFLVKMNSNTKLLHLNYLYVHHLFIDFVTMIFEGWCFKIKWSSNSSSKAEAGCWWAKQIARWKTSRGRCCPQANNIRNAGLYIISALLRMCIIHS